MKTCVIVNQHSGAAQESGEQIRQMAASCAECMAYVDIGDAHQTIAKIAGDGCDRIIVAGGDGTVSHVAGVLTSSFPDMELAILPLGTGNDLARSLGLAIGNLELAWQQAVEGEAQPIDVGHVVWSDVAQESESYFVNVVHGALSGVVAREVAAEDKNRWGAFAYWMTALRKLMDAREYEVSVSIDDEEIDLRAYGVLVANGRYVGGGFPAAPNALLDDGAFDVVLVPVLPTLDLVGAGLDFWLNSQQIDERIRIFRGRQVSIHGAEEIPFSIDGETTSATVATFQILPQALRCVAGPLPPAIAATEAEQTGPPEA